MEINEFNAPSIGGFGVVRDKSVIAPLIRLATRSQVNHAFVVLYQDQGDWRIMESRFHGAQLGWLSEYKDCDVVFSRPLDRDTGLHVATEAIKLQGTPYNFLDIAVLGLMSAGIKWKWLSRIAEKNNRAICSQLVDLANYNAKVHLYTDDRPMGKVVPGDLLMYVALGLSPKLGS